MFSRFVDISGNFSSRIGVTTQSSIRRFDLYDDPESLFEDWDVSERGAAATAHDVVLDGGLTEETRERASYDLALVQPDTNCSDHSSLSNIDGFAGATLKVSCTTFEPDFT